MADCPSCGAPLKDGDWTCGKCGAPVAGAGIAPASGTGGGGAGAPLDPYGPSPGWAPEHQPRPTAAAGAPTRSGPSAMLRLVLVIAVVAIVAIVAVWFFVLRGPSTTGEEFLGTWKATTEQGISAAEIARAEDAFSITLSGSRGDQDITVSAHLDGADLVVTMDDFSQIAGEENAVAFKDALKAVAGEFRLVFSSLDATHLDLRIVGTSASGEDFEEAIRLVKDVAGTM